MKKGIKRFTLIGMSSLMLATTVIPAFAQDYSYDSYNNYQQPPSYQQPNEYNPPAYNQPNYNQLNNYNQPSNYNPVPVQNQNNYNLPPLQGRVVTVPPGTVLPGVTTNRTLSSKNLRVGDNVSVVMNTPFYYGGAMVLPAGTSIVGTVVVAKPAGRMESNGQLMMVFNQAVTPDGQKIGLSGKLATEDGSGLLKGGTGMGRTKEVVKDAAIGAGSGALLGTIFGAISGGEVGKGAAIGSAIGGGTGLLKSGIDKGKDVIIEAGQRLEIILDSELRTGSNQGGNMQPAPNYNYGY